MDGWVPPLLKSAHRYGAAGLFAPNSLPEIVTVFPWVRVPETSVIAGAARAADGPKTAPRERRRIRVYRATCRDIR
jgi:hypothetical protein